jgi:3-oxoacyl-[acyl-carrier protein] reductase
MSTDPTKVVLITGAGGGLGRALTDEFARQSWQVIAGFRQGTPEVSAENVFPVELDVTRTAELNQSVAGLNKRFIHIDALINNAGVTADAALAQLSDEDWQRVLDVNLRGAFACARAVSRTMMRQRDGHIINISSHAGRCGARGQANYSAAKAGLLGLTQSLAHELGSRNVRVNAVLPGILPTKMTAQLSPEQMKGFAQANALGRINSLDEVARFIIFLASTQNISGQVFQLDSRIAPWT